MKKKNPNRLIVDDAVNDDNSVRGCPALLRLRVPGCMLYTRPCVAGSRRMPGQRLGAVSSRRMPGQRLSLRWMLGRDWH
jgi:hypothetical protein